jgi:uroporphyrinogen decarboxylase
MNSRERFNRVMQFEPVDRPPLFEDGIRDEVLRSWRKQGLGKKLKLSSLFAFDYREEIEPDLEPSPAPSRWPSSMANLDKLIQRLNPKDPGRLPSDWNRKVQDWKQRDYPLILRLHRGYFLTMGVHGWHRFTDAAQLLIDNPVYVHAWMEAFGDFSARLADRILDQVEVDAALFSEPIGGNHGPLISPRMYSSFVLESYKPLLHVLKQHGVEIIIYRTYANTRALLPLAVKAGFNCLWACECNPQAMDYREIRREFGTGLRLIGGIDSDSLRTNPQEIQKAVMEIVPGLLHSGGYIPLADGRVREDVTFENYAYYRHLLEEITQGMKLPTVTA